jgi:hypothetical protein
MCYVSDRKLKTIVNVCSIIIVRSRKGEINMELLLSQCEYNQSEEPSEECAPNKENDENLDLYEYDYNKRIWF